ncbi:hypothetical protein BES34_021320 [Leptospira inadai serovar Lyme]|nr:hypothetical protein BES34_021320 [Leptospira inadai serovar Lyme]
MQRRNKKFRGHLYSTLRTFVRFYSTPMEPKFLLIFATTIGAIMATLVIRDIILTKSGGSRTKLLQSLLLIHGYRFVGLSMFIPGITSPSMPTDFSIPAAWGDYIAAILAISSYLLLGRKLKVAIPLVWFFNIWGFVDLLYASYQALTLHISPLMGFMFYIFTGYAPLLVVSHLVIFKILLQSRKNSTVESI